MQTRSMGWMTLASVLAFGLAVSTATLIGIPSASAKTAKGEDPAPSQALSKEDQAKLKEHNKLRSEIMHVKYPASKADVVSHVKGIKADDKKWFEETLPDRTYSSSDEVMSALGWETEGTANADKPPSDHANSKKTSSGSKNAQ